MAGGIGDNSLATKRFKTKSPRQNSDGTYGLKLYFYTSRYSVK